MTDQLEFPGGIRLGTTGWYYPRCKCGAMEFGPYRDESENVAGVWTRGGGGVRHYSSHPNSPACGYHANTSCVIHSRPCDCEMMVVFYGNRGVEMRR